MASDSLTKFRNAMQTVYGPFSDVPSDSTSQWTPPPNSNGHRGRYLWTDAFGVLNFLTLYKESSDEKYLTLAKQLVQNVHDILGRTRDGKSRLPSATDEEPLKGGLRIGKEEESGPDGDGQYHHYLTLWMFALNRLSIAAEEPSYNDQAIQLAKAIHAHFFVDRDSASPRMVWKIAMDMSEPLVPSEGNLDPLSGFVTFRQLQASSKDKDILKEEISDYQKVMDRKGKQRVSNDMLDLGMTLWTAHFLASKEKWAKDLQSRSTFGLLQLFEEGLHLSRPMGRRLAFREFGTCLGIGCYDKDEYLGERASDLMAAWEEELENTPEKLKAITWVMYAAALIPGGKSLTRLRRLVIYELWNSF
jgi:hypothetical protein